jgi:hypothetical protein
MVAAPEDVIVKKLEYYREGLSEKHLRDIAGILQICPYPIDYDYVANWATQLKVLDLWQLIVQRVRNPNADSSASDSTVDE